MTQQLAKTTETPSINNTADDTQSIQIALRLKAVDQSDRAILANITGVHLGSGYAFLDFGFIEQAALESVTRAARSGEQKNPTLDGRLECRIAMGMGDIAQLARQIEQVLATAKKSRPETQVIQADPLAFDPAISLQ